LLLFVFALSASSQVDQLTGFVTAFGEPIHGAHIYNNQRKLLTITDPQGSFKMPVEVGDSIDISHVGLETVSFIVDSALTDEPIYISLASNPILLEEVRVLFPTYGGFKDQILATVPTDSSFTLHAYDQVDYTQVSFPEEPSTEDPEMKQPGGVGVSAPFDLERLTKRGKEKKKYNKLKAREWLVSQANLKFKREWVSEVTKLKDDRLTDFIAFCNFTPEYIVQTPLYIIQEDMMALLMEFEAGNEDRKKDRYTPGS